MSASIAGFVAVTRFGLGGRPGELARAASDPRGWLRAQLAPRPDMGTSTRVGPERMAEMLRARKQSGDAGVQQLLRQAYRAHYAADAGTRTRRLIETDVPFRERLVAFWSNHFTVSIQRPALLGLAGPFEDEAIRPHIGGRFADLLLTVSRHPAMLVYLDNAQSVGPRSRAGQARNRGLNENLAREILELHTLGVGGGYGQADVEALARILTGWSLAGVDDRDAGSFRFRPAIHEPGQKLLLGRRYAEAGEQEGIAALSDLAQHPATARHLATKLARHFIADEPPAASVDRLARVFTESGGDLARVSLALIDDPAAWAEPLAKVKSPQDFVVSALRATGFEGESEKLVPAQAALGQAPFAAPSPAGWPDTAERWVGPESVMRRTEWAMALATRLRGRRPPDALLAETIGPVASAGTRQAVAQAPSTVEAVALLFASPDFQRR